MSGIFFMVVILLATFFTAFLSSIFGMLGGLILMGVLIFIMPVSNAMVLHGLIQLTSNGYRAWLNKKDINWMIISTIIVGNIFSLIGFLWITFVPEKTTVYLILGLLPFIAFILPKKFSLDVAKKPIGIMAGVVVVASNLLSGTGGPLLDIFFQKVKMTRHQVVATKAVAQSLGHISKIIFFGFFTLSSNNVWPSFLLILLTVTASVIGTTLGKNILDRINDKNFFLWTQYILLFIGAIFISYALYLLS
jgi:uncharacterized membrane protein YfcA